MSREGHILRVVRFRSRGVESDGFLRSDTIPFLRGLPGLLDVHAGRRDEPEADNRIVAMVWSDRAAMVSTVGESVALTPSFVERTGVSAIESLEVHEIRIELPFATAEPSVLLRVFRGQVKPGELDAYIAETEAGTLADAAAGRGPGVLYLAADPPDRFVTISLWPSWQKIAEATGGDIRRPTMTKDSSRLIGLDVSHYEVLPV
jgi:hypothetical protein